MNWVVLLVLLSTASTILASSLPAAASPTSCSEKEWWQNTLIYQILVPSFKDSNNDGIGDLRGIIEKIDYLKELGVETLWLTPFYTGPNGDIGYDISNHTEVGKDFGTMADFEELVKVVHSKGMKILVEFVPNHSSDKHSWFVKSANKVDPYTNYYVWKEGKRDAAGSFIPPNNWLSKRSGSMWKFHDHRQQYYLHQFLNELPDLNYRSEDLVKEMNAILEFWLQKGVDGFGMDSVLKLYEQESFPDEPKVNVQLADTDPTAYDHIYTLDQPETYEMLYKWRGILDKYTNESTDKQSRVIITEAYSPTLDKVAGYYGKGDKHGTQLSVNYELMNKFTAASDAKELETVINHYIKSVPMGKWTSWMVGGHSMTRIATRYSPELVDALNMLTLLLPGTAVTFAGDELGMESPFIRYEDQRDPEGFIFGKDGYLKVCRDGSRIPFQWNDQDNAGFSTKKSWLPVHSNYWTLNVQAQKKAKPSHYSVYKDLTTLRSTSRAVRLGGYKVFTPSQYVFILIRTFEKSSVYTIINLNSRTETVDLGSYTEAEGDFAIYTSSVNSGLNNEKLSWSGEGVKKNIVLRPKASVVITKNHNSNECKSSGPSILPGYQVYILSILYLLIKYY
uniref:alpha-glucosidase n=1 Tax=Cacopsylla melanoneura TaxID=428564 RepID=A0A8D8UYG0_9HEMI